MYSVLLHVHCVAVYILLTCSPSWLIEANWCRPRLRITWTRVLGDAIVVKGKYYQANIKTSDGNVLTDINMIVLLLLVPIRLTDVSGDQTVLEGSNTTLFCEATGQPKPNITLNRVLEDGSDDKVLFRQPPWNFPNISRNASGTYRCTAENAFEKVSQVFKVNVTCKYIKYVCMYVKNVKCS